jgi:AmmeMemoRadiSam system protein A
MLKGEMRSKSSPGTAFENLVAPPPGGGPAPLPTPTEDEFFPPALARRAVETLTLEGRILEVAMFPASPLLSARAACFVCLKTVSDKLRGCIGTTHPARAALAEEIVHNAISAATQDPRFPPVSADELPLLRYTVDILESPEPAALDDLNPAEFGVIVEDNTGRRRGLLLPAIEGIEKVCDQVQIATRKAGIASGEPLKLYRFRVRRFREAARA